MIVHAEVRDLTLDGRISCLAYQFWRQRGSPFGSPEIDWSYAEYQIKRNIEPLSESNFTESSIL